MKLFLLTCLAMVAFAANSILTRLAVDSGAASAEGFAVLRIMSGAVVLLALVSLRRKSRLRWTGARRWGGAVSLTIYVVGFTIAYRTMDAGMGALVLFGVVQVAMFALSSMVGKRPNRRDLAGAVVAFGGLVWVLWPSGGELADLYDAGAMVAAGLGWAVYTLLGRREADALAGTAANFALALPLTVAAMVLSSGGLWASWHGMGLAVISGAVTSGLGYALWYSLQPQLGAIRSAIVQLSVPVIALVGGALWLGEIVGLHLTLGTVLVLGGIALTLPRPNWK
jgi:drug/metabolite transporter (DMT)-like permease